jgi:hypothetical protein
VNLPLRRAVLALLAGLAVAHAQTPAFDVVSIKMSAPDQLTTGSRGGPGASTRACGPARTCPFTASFGSRSTSARSRRSRSEVADGKLTPISRGEYCSLDSQLALLSTR